MKKVLVLVGPTAVGKTAFSIELAKRFHGEIISGDSIQVYREMCIRDSFRMICFTSSLLSTKA